MRSRTFYQNINTNNEDNSILSDDSLKYEVIPRVILNYFPVPEGIRRDEFEFIIHRLENIYRDDFVNNYQKDVFDVYYTPNHFVNIFSSDIGKIERSVKYMKGRPDFDDFLEKYSFSQSLKQPFMKKATNINYLMTKFRFGRFKNSKCGKLSYTYLLSSMIFRLNCRPNIARLLPRFELSNLIQLSGEVDYSMNYERWPKHKKFWSEYELFWEEFGYDEIFTPWEYAKAFVENMISYFKDEEVKIHNTLILLRLTKSQLFGKFGETEGMYYFLCAVDLAIDHNPIWKILPFWVIDGLKMYGDRQEIKAFCKIRNINLA